MDLEGPATKTYHPSEGSSSHEHKLNYKNMEVKVSKMEKGAEDCPLGLQLKPFSSIRHWKNLFSLSITFFLVFTAFYSIQNIQSSINTEGGLLSLAVVAATSILSGLVTPFVISRLTGAKWAVAFSTLVFCAYSYVNIFRVPWLTMAVSVALGIAQSPLWIGHCTYITRAAYQLAAITGKREELIINRMHGTFHLILGSSLVSGNLILFLILSDPDPQEVALDTSYCGALNCGTNIGSGVPPPSRGTANVLFGVFTAVGIASALLSTFGVDDQQVPKGSRKQNGDISTAFGGMYQLLREFKIVLLLPLFAVAGFQLAFFYSDFSKAYVACSQGMSSVGLVAISYGVSLSVCSLLFGQLEKFTDRIVRITFGCFAHLALLFYLFYLEPVQGEYLPLFAVASGWGMCCAVWRSQVTSLVGALFPHHQEAAFTIWSMGEALGNFSGFLLPTFSDLCVSHRIIILAGAIIVAFCLYLICEQKVRYEKREGAKFTALPTKETRV